MSLLSKLAARRLGLVPLYPVDVRRGVSVSVPGSEGVELRTDLYAPRGRTRGPTILIRSPYGRRPFGFSMATPLATQGYHVVLQSCRGTTGSTGVFDPHHDEHETTA